MEVLFATPSYGKQISPEHHHAMVQTARELTMQGIAFGQHLLTGSPFVDQARNSAVEYFLKQTSADFLFFVDDDVGFDYECVTRMLSHGVDIVGGLVPKRTADTSPDYHSNAITGVMRDGLMECMELPTAFMRISRPALERYAQAYPGQPFFRAGPYKDEPYIGEDIFFCRQWCALGERLWIDADISFTHRGSHAWRGNFYDHAVQTGLLITSAAA